MPDGPIRLEAPPHFDPPRLTDLGEGIEVSAPVRTSLTSVYWDTADLRLARWGASLVKDLEDGWMIQLPGQQGSSVRVRQPIVMDGFEDAPPEHALDLLRAYVRSATLAPVGRMKRLRQTVSVGSGNNGTRITVLSDEVSVLDGRRVAIRYRSLVLDAGRDAEAGLVHGVVARLRAAGAGGPDPVPEFARVLGPAALEAPEISPVRVGRDSTVAEAVTAALAASVLRLMRHDAGVRVGAENEAVHQARVATRRLRSDLGTFASVLDRADAERLRVELKWLGGLLGDVRDTDVLIERMSRLLAEIPGPAAGERALLGRLQERRDAARKSMLAGLRSTRYSALLDDLVALAVAPPITGDGQKRAAGVLPRLVAGPWRRLERAIARLGDDPADEDLHGVRIAAKRVRYAAEAVAPVVGKPAGSLAAGVAVLQTALGDYNDSVVARAWLGEVAAKLGSGSAFYAGVITERERQAGEEALKKWQSAWKKVARKKSRNWMS